MRRLRRNSRPQRAAVAYLMFSVPSIQTRAAMRKIRTEGKKRNALLSSQLLSCLGKQKREAERGGDTVVTRRVAPARTTIATTMK